MAIFARFAKRSMYMLYHPQQHKIWNWQWPIAVVKAITQLVKDPKRKNWNVFIINCYSTLICGRKRWHIRERRRPDERRRRLQTRRRHRRRKDKSVQSFDTLRVRRLHLQRTEDTIWTIVGRKRQWANKQRHQTNTIVNSSYNCGKETATSKRTTTSNQYNLAAQIRPCPTWTNSTHLW